MHRLFTAPWKPAALISTLALGLFAPSSADAVSVSTIQLQILAGDTQASINGVAARLDEPAAIINGRFYVPAKWVADALGLSLEWHSASQTIRFLTGIAYIEMNPSADIITSNGNPVAFHSVAEIHNGHLLVDLDWLSKYAGLTYRYNEVAKSVELNYVGRPGAPYKESALIKDDSQPNSKPVALFAFGKPAYRLGEPVDYIDLSYDPDAEGLPDYEWTGKQEAFFKPGAYTITLAVKDGLGNRSEPFSRTVNVLDEMYVSENNYPLYFKPAGTMLNKNRIQTQSVQTAGQLNIQSALKQTQERPLLIGGSKLPVTETGFLFHEKITKQARLYPQYVNGTEKPVQFAVVLRNTSEIKPATISTSRKSEAPVSIYTNVTANKTVEHFLALNDEAFEDIVIQPGSAVFYKISQEVAPGQAFQGIYDIETDGAISASYVMVSLGEKAYDLGKYIRKSIIGNFDGTFSNSEISWKVDARGALSPIAIRVGEIAAATMQKDKASVSALEPSVQGYAGIRYRIGVDISGKTALVLRPTDGYFQGALRVNGRMIPLPAGGLTANDAILLHRTNGETFIEIELMASGGSWSPVDLLLVPLQNKR